MSKGNMLLGHARGKVGDLVFTRVNGKQVTRARAAVVKNPQTEAQMIQRILLNTISQAYSKMSEICDHSFEGVAAGQPSMAYFMRRNLNLIRMTLSEIGDLDAAAPMTSPIGTNGLASNTYVVAKGQLPEIIPEVGTGGLSIALAANTYEAVLAATGLQRGDQLTVITVSGSEYTDQKFNYSRIILDPIEEDGSEAPLSTEFITNGAIVKPNPRNQNTGHTYSFSDGEFLVSITAQQVNMAAAIGSRQKTDGTWLRSNAALILAEGASIGYTTQESLDLFASGGLDIENPLYLNNAVRTARMYSASGGYIYTADDLSNAIVNPLAVFSVSTINDKITGELESTTTAATIQLDITGLPNLNSVELDSESTDGVSVTKVPGGISVVFPTPSGTDTATAVFVTNGVQTWEITWTRE